ncbi:MAG TPA: NUDIX hydrolase [Steroidobacteraceae bacterium]|jgi:8-oxo-dGTP pyrophosphatase MutT (NUDIX family)|nr:NUDIX hydrolase [Steroidobacteraceae bacterium]
MRWNPEVTVAAIVELDRRFLIVEERVAGRLVLNQPAGHLEDRESLIEAVIRETREETAWRFQPEALVGTYLWRSPVDGRSFLRFAFCGTVDDHRPQQPLDKGIVRTLWMSHEQLLAQSTRLRSPLVLGCLQDFLLGKRQPLESVACLGLETALRVDSVVNL